MATNREPILHEVLSVQETGENNVYIARVDLTDENGERYECDYVARPDDPYGVAPLVREAIEDWIIEGKTISDAPNSE